MIAWTNSFRICILFCCFTLHKDFCTVTSRGGRKTDTRLPAELPDVVVGGEGGAALCRGR